MVRFYDLKFFLWDADKPSVRRKEARMDSILEFLGMTLSYILVLGTICVGIIVSHACTAMIKK
jgi:hypothetical protein